LSRHHALTSSLSTTTSYDDEPKYLKVWFSILLFLIITNCLLYCYAYRGRRNMEERALQPLGTRCVPIALLLPMICSPYHLFCRLNASCTLLRSPQASLSRTTAFLKYQDTTTVITYLQGTYPAPLKRPIRPIQTCARKEVRVLLYDTCDTCSLNSYKSWTLYT
jgi:hypothetical protein